MHKCMSWSFCISSFSIYWPIEPKRILLLPEFYFILRRSYESPLLMKNS